MGEVPQANVLFVNIGWAPNYDGNHLILGNYGYARQQGRDPSKLGEGSAFLPDSSGRVKCIVGRGQVKPETPIDVVFVARNPSNRHHEIVGIYFRPSFSYRFLTDANGRRAVLAYASTWHFKELVGNQRPPIMWPGRVGMRRWVSQSGAIRYAELFDQYIALI